MTDTRNQTECLLNMAMDHIAWTLEQPTDPRAWRHLLSYCPLEILEAAYVRKSQRMNDDVSGSPMVKCKHDVSEDCPACMRETIEALTKALRIFLGEEDERFQVAIGGNPIAVEKMLQEARALVGGAR